MAHHKRGRSRNQRGGCKMCKFWKVNGHRTERDDGERFSDHRRRVTADIEIKEAVSIPSVWTLPYVMPESFTTVGSTSDSAKWVILTND